MRPKTNFYNDLLDMETLYPIFDQIKCIAQSNDAAPKKEMTSFDHIEFLINWSSFNERLKEELRKKIIGYKMAELSRRKEIEKTNRLYPNRFLRYTPEEVEALIKAAPKVPFNNYSEYMAFINDIALKMGKKPQQIKNKYRNLKITLW